MRRTLPAGVRGFTLLEVLVAVTVFAIMSTVSYVSLMKMLDGRGRIAQENRQWNALATTFALLEQDLANARGRTVYNAYGAIIEAFLGRPVDSRPLGPPSLEFTRAGAFPAGDGALSDLSRVEYALSENKLVRRVWATLDQVPPNKPLEVVLLTEIDNLSARFYSAQSGWTDKWPVNPGNLLDMPTAVEVAFDVKGVGRLTRVMMVGE